MESENRRRQLPALSWLDVDNKVKREDESFPPRSNGTPHATSPTSLYPQGPPPPYSHARVDTPQSAPPPNSWPVAAVAQSPSAEKRPRVGEELDGHSVMPRQSLPSISEALGVDTQVASAASSRPAHYLPPPPPPPPTSAPRSHAIDQPPAPAQQPTSGAAYSSYPQYRPDYPTYPPTTHPKTQSPPTSQLSASTSAPYLPSSHESLPPHTSAPAAAPSLPYGYTAHPAQSFHPVAPLALAGSAGPVQQPALAHAPSQSQPSGWRVDRTRPAEQHLGAPVHSESVKRHLDLYDLEVALNEIADLSPILTDFSRRYGDRMHQTQRSGAALSMLPGLGEIDDMIHKSRLQLDALAKIRDVVLTQHAAYEQHAADQRQQQKAYEDAAAAASTTAPPMDEGADGKAGGAMGVDGTKKRRGRAAPPGRCHSCHRAETPEWRRGPDGARTLCNACGLHYAKLTRKQNSGNKAANISSSMLRPKEAAPPPPPPPPPS